MESSEHRDRIERVNALVKKAGLDAFLVTSKDSVYYLTGFKYEPFERPFFLIFRGDGVRDVPVELSFLLKAYAPRRNRRHGSRLIPKGEETMKQVGKVIQP
jgi:Xaa-Pro aminopeptidase